MQLLLRRKVSWHWLVLLVISSCFCGMAWPAQAHAATGTIADDAHVLNTSTIRQYTDPFSYTVDIYTTTVFQGSNDAFDASVKELTSNDMTMDGSTCDPKTQVGCEPFPSGDQSMPGSTDPGTGTPIAGTPTATALWLRVGGTSQSIEIGINVTSRHLAIFAGDGVTIPQDHYNTAIQTFASTMQQTNDDYTQATIAALDALQSAGDRFSNGVGSALPWLGYIAVIFAVAVGAGLLLRAMGVRGSSSGSSWRSSEWYGSNNWSSGGGGGDWGGGGGGSSDSGGGGGGASGNF